MDERRRHQLEHADPERRPLDIALVQAASSLPMFLFALPSGVMADIVDRRKYLLFSQLWVFIAAAGLTVLSFTGHVTPPFCWWRRFC
jgi:MFS family permease